MGEDKEKTLRIGMVGAGMIFEETYAPAFERLRGRPLFGREAGAVEVELAAIATRTGVRAQRLLESGRLGRFANLSGQEGVDRLLCANLDAVCVATPDDRHFEAARKVLAAGKHLLVEKPSVLRLAELDELRALAEKNGVLAKVVYHKLLDPDHKRLRTLVVDGVLRDVSSGYCTLLEPISIATGQFGEWVAGRNPGTYVAVHYIKLIDFTFGGRLRAVSASGQRGLVGPVDGPTWDSVQLRLLYAHEGGREAAFDIHTNWVTPDNFPGYVEQEVQFRFANGVWNGHGRKRGVELTVAGRTPTELKSSLNNHYNAELLEPWGERRRRGYGIEAVERFFEEVAMVEFGGPRGERDDRLAEARALAYNDLAADRQTVAAVEALEAILEAHARGRPDAVCRINDERGGLVLHELGGHCRVLYAPAV